MYLSQYQKEPFFLGKLDNNYGVQKERAISLANPNQLNPNLVKVSSLVAPDPTDQEMQYLQQMGITHCYTWVQPQHCTVDHLKKLKSRLASYGITLWSVGNKLVGKNKDIILGTKQRDKAIKDFIAWLGLLSKAEIGITIFTWESDGVWSTHENLVRGDALGRACDTEILGNLPPKYGRVYTDEELWSNMKYFLDKILPEAEKANVKLALHPNDPPTDKKIAGVPCIMRSKAAFDKVFELGNQSNYLRMEFCCGSWLEGGKPMGNLLESLRDFLTRDKVVIIHLRNVTSPLPKFTETFLDDGYGDIFEIIRTITEYKYSGTIILDHSPEFNSVKGAETAFALGYIKASIRAAQALQEPRPSDLTAILDQKTPKKSTNKKTTQQDSTPKNKKQSPIKKKQSPIKKKQSPIKKKQSPIKKKQTPPPQKVTKKINKKK